MPELRWALIGLGAVVIAGLALWEWRRARRRLAQDAPTVVPVAGPQHPSADEPVRRIEPRIDGMVAGHGHGADRLALREVPVIHPTEPLAVPVAREAAVDMPAAASRPAMAAASPAMVDAPAFASPPTSAPLAAVPSAGPGPQDAPAPQSSQSPVQPPQASATSLRWPPERADRVLTLRLASADGALLQGREVRLALEQAGLVPGPQTIFHRADAHGAVLVSAASMLRPGDLDPQLMDEQQFRGLSLFSVLPGPLQPVRMLEELVGTARAVAWRLGVQVQDDRGAELDGDRLVKLRQSLPDAAGEGSS